MSSLTKTLEDVAKPEGADGTAWDGVGRGGEDTVDHPVLAFRQGVGGALDLVKVEGELAWDGAVESGLDEGGPPVGPPLRPAPVVLAYPSHTGKDGLAAVDVLHGGLTEEEVDVVIVLQRAHELGCCTFTE